MSPDEEALFGAAQYNKTEQIRLLVSSGVSVDCRDSEGLTPLMAAVIVGAVDSVSVLIELGASTEARCNPKHFYGNWRPIDFTTLHASNPVNKQQIKSILDVHLPKENSQ